MVALLVALQLSLPIDLRVRIAGYVMTLLGVVLVARSVRETQTLFGRPTYRERTSAWLKRFPLIFRSRQTIALAGAATLGFSGARATATVRAIAQDSSLEARITAMEENFRRVDERISLADQAVYKEIDTVRDEIAREKSERQLAHTTLAGRLEDYSAGGLDGELVGIAWVIVGQAYGSFPAEIGSFLFR